MNSCLKVVRSHAIRRQISAAPTPPVHWSQMSLVISVLNPYLEYEEKIYHSTEYAESLRKRGIQLDVKEISNMWGTYVHLQCVRNQMEKFKKSVKSHLKAVSKNPDEDRDNPKVQHLRKKGKVVRDDLKSITAAVKGLEEVLLPQLLKLPNLLDPRCGTQPTVLDEFGGKVDKRFNHIDAAENCGLVYYLDPFHYYLKGDMVMFQRCLVTSFRRHLLANNFVQISPPNFTRSVTVTGCGRDQGGFFRLDNVYGDTFNNSFLCGSATQYPFCSLLAKKIVDQKDLPLKWFSTGTIYNPTATSSLGGLYDVSQLTGGHVFIVCAPDDAETMFKEAYGVVKKWYEKLDFPLRTVYSPAWDMHPSENLRVSFQAYSSFFDKYVEIGSLSSYRDYLSKRLRMYYGLQKGKDFSYVISGTVFQIPPLLACCLEANKDVSGAFDILHTQTQKSN